MKRILKVETVRSLHIIIIQSLIKEMKLSLTGIHAGIFNTNGLKDKNEIWANVDETTIPPKKKNLLKL